MDKLLQVEPSHRLPLEQVFNHPWILRYRPKPPKLVPKPAEEKLMPNAAKSRDEDVMRELEEFVKDKKPLDAGGNEVYDMCDTMLRELDVLESTFGRAQEPLPPPQPRRY